MTAQNRTTGWLTPGFHMQWKSILLHACSRYDLFCPTYTLMPDHAHLLFIGTNLHASDQRQAIEFTRRHTRRTATPALWQHQVHDHVLAHSERAASAFATCANYIRENPVRAALVQRPEDWPFCGCCLPGYPEFELEMPDFWERFWRCYNYTVYKRAA
jgi:putative transposase